MATVADTYGSGDDFRNHLRAMVGNPNDTVLLPDDTVDGCVSRAWNVFARDFARRNFGSFSTASGTQSYTPLSGIDDALSLRKVWWPIPADCQVQHVELANSIDTYLTEAINDLGTRVLKDPALVAAHQRKMTWLKRLRPVGATIINQDTVYLDPVPSSVRTVYFEYMAKPATGPGTLPEEKAEPLLALIQSMLHEALSAGAGGVNQVRDDEEGTWIMTEAPKNHREHASRLKMRYDSFVPPPVPRW